MGTVNHTTKMTFVYIVEEEACLKLNEDRFGVTKGKPNHVERLGGIERYRTSPIFPYRRLSVRGGRLLQ